MKRMRVIPAILLMIAVLTSSCQEISDRRARMDDIFTRFEGALKRGDYAAAYGLMCPEYHDEAGVAEFARAIKASPYLQNMQSLRCKMPAAVMSAVPSTEETSCILENSFGMMQVKVHLRQSKKECCVVSLVVAGEPVLCAGCGRRGR